MKSEYGIRSDYTHRREISYFDDTTLEDEWQKEVYLRAAKLMAEDALSTLIDVGCGSAFKLMNYLGQYETLGLDVPETVAFLKEKYPARAWGVSDFDGPRPLAADLVICSDVIEHVSDPIALMKSIQSIAKKWIVLSTPDRDLVYPENSPFHFGPPQNTTHIREWNFGEFGSFINEFVEIDEHIISNAEQATQMIVGRVRA
jgi:hypothetical protein